MRQRICKRYTRAALERGTHVEREEHGLSLKTSRKIARDHLCVNPRHYSRPRRGAMFAAFRFPDYAPGTKLTLSEPARPDGRSKTLTIDAIVVERMKNGDLRVARPHDGKRFTVTALDVELGRVFILGVNRP
jgi:hypothetical protein